MITPIPGFSEPFSSITHLASAFIAFVAAFFLLYRGRGNSRRVVGLLIYSFCLVFLFSMSGVYHLLEKGFAPNYVLQILDHVGIYCVIAGTFTPMHLILFRGAHRWLVLVIIWTLSIIALTLTAVFFDDIPEWLSLSFFLGLGWIGLFSVWKIYQIHSKELVSYIILGGVAYTIGAVFEFIRWPKLVDGVVGPHEIFHVFVMMGAYFHWTLVFKIARYPISSNITILVTEYPNGRYEAQATSEHAHFEGKSKDEIKGKVMDWIKRDFHDEMQPFSVRFKYSREEFIEL